MACPTCGAAVSFWERDLVSGRCRKCVTRQNRARREEAVARELGMPVEQLRAREDADRAREEEARHQWLRSALRHYLTTAEWPPPRYDLSGKPLVAQDAFSRLILTVGQILAVLACVISVVGGLWSLDATTAVSGVVPGADAGVVRFWVVVGTTVTAAFCAAMFLVFTRAKWVVRLVESQQAVLYQLLRTSGLPDAEPAAAPGPARP